MSVHNLMPERMKKLNNRDLQFWGLFVLPLFLITGLAKGQCPPVCFGTSNIAFGNGAGNPATSTGIGVVSVGSAAGAANTSGILNVFFGSNSGLSNSTGNNNSYLGADAGQHIINGSTNICVGKSAGPSVDSSSISNRLYIDVEETNDPLIYGEFDNNIVRINGTLEVTAGLANPSSIHLKERFSPVDATGVLDKISDLDVSEWSYKSHPNISHIGPTAEVFYQLFGLGQDDQSICTIDADGIVLAAIQALDKKIEEREQLLKRVEILMEKNKELRTRYQQLEQRVGVE